MEYIAGLVLGLLLIFAGMIIGAVIVVTLILITIRKRERGTRHE